MRAPLLIIFGTILFFFVGALFVTFSYHKWAPKQRKLPSANPWVAAPAISETNTNNRPDILSKKPHVKLIVMDAGVSEAYPF